MEKEKCFLVTAVFPFIGTEDMTPKDIRTEAAIHFGETFGRECEVVCVVETGFNKPICFANKDPHPSDVWDVVGGPDSEIGK